MYKLFYVLMFVDDYSVGLNINVHQDHKVTLKFDSNPYSMQLLYLHFCMLPNSI